MSNEHDIFSEYLKYKICRTSRYILISKLNFVREFMKYSLQRKIYSEVRSVLKNGELFLNIVLGVNEFDWFVGYSQRGEAGL